MKLSFMVTLWACLLTCMAVSVSAVEDFALIVTVFQGGSGPEHEVTATTPIRPGEPLRFCIKAADNTDGVYVQNIESMTWSVSASEVSSSPVVNHHENDNLSVLDCSESFGVCCVDFFVDESASLLMTDFADLTVSGSAILAFGAADHRRKLANRRWLEEELGNSGSNDEIVSSNFTSTAGIINPTASTAGTTGILKATAAEASGAEKLHFILGVALATFVTMMTGAVFVI
jgi:hypothetical protein